MPQSLPDRPLFFLFSPSALLSSHHTPGLESNRNGSFTGTFDALDGACRVGMRLISTVCHGAIEYDDECRSGDKFGDCEYISGDVEFYVFWML